MPRLLGFTAYLIPRRSAIYLNAHFLLSNGGIWLANYCLN
jgi:hypothetical protein